MSFYCLASILIHITLVTTCGVEISPSTQQQFSKNIQASPLTFSHILTLHSSQNELQFAHLLKYGFSYMDDRNILRKVETKEEEQQSLLIRYRKGEKEVEECVSFLWLPWQITTNKVAYNNRNLFWRPEI